MYDLEKAKGKEACTKPTFTTLTILVKKKISVTPMYRHESMLLCPPSPHHHHHLPQTHVQWLPGEVKSTQHSYCPTTAVQSRQGRGGVAGQRGVAEGVSIFAPVFICLKGEAAPKFEHSATVCGVYG